MFKRVLIPLDGSEFAERVLTHLAHFISPTRTQLVLVGVLETARFSLPIYDLTSPPTLNSVRDEYDTYLQGVRKRLQHDGYYVFATVTEGDAAEEIIETADSTGCDLIAMATHGRSGVARLALGSVAERVIHGASLPVLLVRGRVQAIQERVQRILVPLDGSELAEQALPHAQKLAQETGAAVSLLQVISPTDIQYPFANAYEPYGDRFEQPPSRLIESVNAYLDSVGKRLQPLGIHYYCHSVYGNVASTICLIAEGEEVDLIVMGTHGRSGLGRWVYGSVTGQVIHGAPCPILVVRNAPMEKVSQKEPVKTDAEFPLGYQQLAST
jgi:nucleotide-binding universal stress UspA family protein